ncbi:MAG TPA: Rieske 2Fe-2S domain-containing protein [Chloroflexota bacterium]
MMDMVHTGPDTLAGRYMRRFWQPVHVADKVAPGRAIPIRVMGEDLTFYRGESGSPHLLAFRCAHRGTQLSTGWVEGEDLRCFYHGWKYGGSGQCIEQPAEPQPFCDRISITSYPVQDYLGLVFAYLGDEAERPRDPASEQASSDGRRKPPPFPRLPWFEELGGIEAHSQTLPCNYFNRMDNSVDPAHVPLTHRYPGHEALTGPGAPQVAAEEQPWGVTTRSVWPNGRTTIQQVLMPNLFVCDIGEGSWAAKLLGWRVPIDDDHFMSVNVAGRTGQPQPVWGAANGKRDRSEMARAAGEQADRVLEGSTSMADLTESESIFEVQDYVAQVGQGAIADRNHEHLGRADLGLVLLREIWARELQALSEGGPLKAWEIPASLTLDTGGV